MLDILCWVCTRAAYFVLCSEYFMLYAYCVFHAGFFMKYAEYFMLYAEYYTHTLAFIYIHTTETHARTHARTHTQHQHQSMAQIEFTHVQNTNITKIVHHCTIVFLKGQWRAFGVK